MNEPHTASTILVIEDDLDIRRSLEEILSLEGYHVQTARNGQEGLQNLENQSEQPQLILLDLAMPIMDGAQFLEQHRSNDKIKHIPVVLLTAAGTAKAAVVPATEVIKKPIDIDSLLDVVRRYAA